ncbi:hypothetical protein [Blattabacterium cuenoti]|uniref:hypothetical protein n=1 Tax=Blattabacterium cuenoti TaxID=1653831 RepID=UPI00163CE511|nr:hypothetical protein [Blattabacterium cuenoti]
MFLKFQKIRILIFFLGLFFLSIYNKQKIEEKVSTFILNTFFKKVRNHFHERIIIKHASINFLKKELVFYDVKILDHHSFSFIHFSKCKIHIHNLLYFIFINSQYLIIKNIVVDNPSFFIKKYLREKENNILFFIKNFLIHKKFSQNYFMTCSKLIINKSNIKYKNYNNYNQEFQSSFSSYIRNIRIDNYQIKASISSLQSKGLFRKKNVFIKNLFCNLIYYSTSKRLEVNNFLLKTPNSYLKGYITLFQDKKNKIPKIDMRCKIFEGSKLGSDLGIFFYKKWNFDYKIFVRCFIYGQFYHKKKVLFFYNVLIKDSYKNKLYSSQIHAIYINQKLKKIDFLKVYIQFNLS